MPRTRSACAAVGQFAKSALYGQVTVRCVDEPLQEVWRRGRAELSGTY